MFEIKFLQWQNACEILYETIYSSTKRIVILCSSDLSHYHRARIAEEMDCE